MLKKRATTRSLAKVFAGIVLGVCVPVISGLTGIVFYTTVAREAQSPSSSATRLASPRGANSELDLRLVFYGYPQIGVPQSGAAVISETGLSNIRDITFTRIGGELSPDGRWIAYDNCSGFKRGIYLAEPNGSNAQLLAPLKGESCVDVRWSLDGAKLSYTGPPDWSLRILDITSQQNTVIPNTGGADWHWWSPAGNEIVYGQKPISTRGRLLYITDLSGNSRQLTFAKDFAPCERERNIVDIWGPAWSPRGNTIAFTQCGRLFVISPSGNELRQLSPTYAYSPRWSPDGRWIFFIDDKSFLKRISVDGKTIVKVGRLPYRGGPFSIAPLD